MDIRGRFQLSARHQHPAPERDKGIAGFQAGLLPRFTGEVTGARVYGSRSLDGVPLVASSRGQGGVIKVMAGQQRELGYVT